MRRWLAGLIVVAAVALAGCGSPVAIPDRAPAISVGALSALGVGVQHGRVAAHRPLELPDRKPYGVRSDDRYLPIYGHAADQHPVTHMDTHNPLGQEFRLPLTQIRTEPDGSGWLRVLLPDDRLGPSGWVRTDDVHVVTLRERLVVDLSSFRLRHYRDRKLLQTFRVGVGRPEFPTPTGTYFIWARVPQGMPNGPYGVFALGTSAFSSVIDDGRVGVHGTADPTDRGQRVSHGCIRVYNTDMMMLEHVPLGTPLVIRD
jgi:hypothetical protein